MALGRLRPRRLASAPAAVKVSASSPWGQDGVVAGRYHDADPGRALPEKEEHTGCGCPQACAQPWVFRDLGEPAGEQHDPAEGSGEDVLLCDQVEHVPRVGAPGEVVCNLPTMSGVVGEADPRCHDLSEAERSEGEPCPYGEPVACVVPADRQADQAGDHGG